MPGCKAKTAPQTGSEPLLEQSTPVPSSTPAFQATPSPSPPPTEGQDFKQAAAKVQPAVILITAFDSSGKVLRTGTGFFVSDTGRIITTLHTMDGAVNAVAKTANDGLYNIAGVLASSSKMDLAVLNADVKQVPFVALNKSARVEPQMQVAVVGCPLAGAEGAPAEAKISDKEIDNESKEFGIAASVPEISLGAPVVDQNGEVLGIVTAQNKEGQGSVVVRPISAIESVIDDVESSNSVSWPGAPPPPPTATPPLRARVVYAPPPIYPPESRVRGVRSGRYRLNFDSRGAVKSIQVLQSTGIDALDRAAIDGLQKWRSQPGREGYVIVPLTFQNR